MPRPFIMAAPNGARRSKADHPALPISMDEITATALACHKAGADALHLHIRDAQGGHSLDPGQYAETLAEIARAAPELALQITTEAADRFDVATQLGCIKALKPAWASVSIREMARDPDLAAQLYATAADHGTRLQHILYDLNDAAQLALWRKRGIVHPDQSEVLLVLGRYDAGPASSPDQIAPFLAATSIATGWMLCAFGAMEHPCLHAAAALGGDLRVGFENSLIAPDGTLWPDNAASVAALRQALSTLNSA